ncbi:DUF5590 domain-containing protein [Chungangia koreensis]|uniref:DUF5590 domain-containing protein n=1 Tax=Chungangia koreensis TaxID=752657 RepID=A0ABV8X4S6_9LACT
MKNWIIFISVFLVSLALVISVIVLVQARSPYKTAEQVAEQTALDEGEVVSVTDSYVYRGLTSNMTVIGKDEEGRTKAVLIPEGDSNNEVYTVLLEEGISQEDTLNFVQSEMDVKEVLHIRLGLEEVGPVWEVSYIGTNDKLNYVYILFENGNWWKRILNL